MTEPRPPSPVCGNGEESGGGIVIRTDRRYRRIGYTIAGIISLVVGMIGVFLPILPTTPFILLSAACFYRGSEPMHRWLIANRWFGPMIRDWEKHRAVTRKIKVRAIALSSVSMTVSTLFFVPHPSGKCAMAAIGLSVVVYLWRLPEV